MKAILEELRKDTNEFKKHWLAYFLLLLMLDLINQYIAIPVFRFITTYLLQASAIPFVSYQNILTIITTHTIIFVILLLELLVLLGFIYAQFAFLLLATRAIKNDNFNLKSVFKETLTRIAQIRFGSLLLLTLYFLLIVPFVDIIFRTPLLAKIQIPQFILDYMTRTPLLLTILISFYVIIIFLGVRLLFTLPIMIFNQKNTLTAMKQSWQLTKRGGWWNVIVRLLLLAIITGIFVSLFYAIIYGLQLLCDLLPGKYLSLTFGILNLSLIQIFSEVVLVYTTVVGLFILFKPLDLPTLPAYHKKHRSKLLVVMTALVAVIVIATAATTNTLYLAGVNAKQPLVISHRGVDNKNGVQNTIEALKKTAKLKPDFVEIDLHETKDKKFVVLHDETLTKLTGVDKAPKDLTLKQLTRLTAKEDGHSAKIASFDQYLREAKKLKQKLLIEIKTTPKDSKKMLQRFNDQYGKIVLKRNYQVQSLDYRAIEQLKQINPKLFVLYIQPYNFTYPQSIANGYSMEYSTLNSDFIWQAHLQKHPVYAWTVNDSKLMKKMMYEQVDGIITDQVKLAKKTIKEFQEDSSYANRILNYIIVVHMPNSLEV